MIDVRVVRDVMTEAVVSVRPGTPLKDVAKLLVERRISGVPVVDEAGTVLGVVSETDLLVKEQGTDAVPHRPLARFVGESPTTLAQLAKVRAVTAGEAMTAPAITIGPDRRINDAAATMIKRSVNRLPVVEQGRLVGVVTRADLVRAYVRSDAELAHAIRAELDRMLMSDAQRWTIRVTDGVVELEGSVERRSTADAVGRVVRMVPGVVDVDVEVDWAVDDLTGPIDDLSVPPMVMR